MQTKNIRHYKRYRMEIELDYWQQPAQLLQPGYRLIPWQHWHLENHAEVKYLSFRDEIDAQVFPCLGAYESCRRLMEEIQAKDGFLPEATWLAQYDGACGKQLPHYCGTIQAIAQPHAKGCIQNIGVLPHHRGHGLGAGLIAAALLSLKRLGLTHACLEVTTVNQRAVKLYHRLGFRTVRTLYKTVELAYSDLAR